MNYCRSGKKIDAFYSCKLTEVAIIGMLELYQNGKIAFDSRGNTSIKMMQVAVKQLLPDIGGAENVVALGAQPYVPRSER